MKLIPQQGIFFKQTITMAKKSGTVLKLGLVCTVCKSRNYITSRNKLNTPEKLSLSKFCRKCRKVQPHKETEKLK